LSPPRRPFHNVAKRTESGIEFCLPQSNKM
jgi:hypothetical protein